MALRSYSGNASSTTITSGIGTSDTSITIDSATGWPTTTDGPFFATIDRGLSTEEKILVTVRSGTSLTATRGVDDTSAAAHTSGSTIEHTLTATDLEEANAHVNATSGVHGATGAILGVTDHDVEARHTFGAAYGTPVAPSDVSTAASAGTGNNPAREDHVHDIAAGAIDNANKFAAGVVDSAAIATGAVGSDEIAEDAVGNSELADNAVAKANIQDDAVGAAEIDFADLTGTAPVDATGSANAVGAGPDFALADHVHRGGIAVVTAATRPGSPYEGQMIYETDTDKMLFWNGTEWRDVGINNRILFYDSGAIAAPQATFDIQNIPQTYHHISVEIIGRSSDASTSGAIQWRANNNSTGIYDSTYTDALNTTNATQEVVDGSAGIVGIMEGTTAVAADIWGAMHGSIRDYANSAHRPFFNFDSAIQRAANEIFQRQGWALLGTAEAVNRVTFFPYAGDWIAGSRCRAWLEK